jgi:hypothetical protein
MIEDIQAILSVIAADLLRTQAALTASERVRRAISPCERNTVVCGPEELRSLLAIGLPKPSPCSEVHG